MMKEILMPAPDSASQERAVPGLHESLVSRLPKDLKRDAWVLDIGCGTGAWISRLRANGFSRLHGIDRDISQFGLRDVTIWQADLDTADWGTKDLLFDLITMIEVLEHLENPGAVLRKLSRMLVNDGYLLITTPNLHSVAARAKFLVTGKLRHFDESGDPTHIYPVFLSNLKKLFTRSGLSIVERWGYPAGGALLGTRNWLKAPVRMLRTVLPEEAPGDVLCILASRR
jgi:2-polyprenyl-3-methyl-5-hydroxy-6-metoxy-1,4-benzoquinol methylase